MIELIGLLLALVVAGVVAARLAEHGVEDRGRPCTRDDPRCIETARRLDDARRAMVARGTPLLLVDRPPWESVTPAGNVVPFRRS